jgi:hypothetical protein
MQGFLTFKLNVDETNPGVISPEVPVTVIVYSLNELRGFISGFKFAVYRNLNVRVDPSKELTTTFPEAVSVMTYV